MKVSAAIAGVALLAYLLRAARIGAALAGAGCARQLLIH